MFVGKICIFASHYLFVKKKVDVWGKMAYKMDKINVRVSEELKGRFLKRLKDDGYSQSGVLRILIEGYVEGRIKIIAVENK